MRKLLGLQGQTSEFISCAKCGRNFHCPNLVGVAGVWLEHWCATPRLSLQLCGIPSWVEPFTGCLGKIEPERLSRNLSRSEQHNHNHRRPYEQYELIKALYPRDIYPLYINQVRLKDETPSTSRPPKCEYLSFSEHDRHQMQQKYSTGRKEHEIMKRAF